MMPKSGKIKSGRAGTQTSSKMPMMTIPTLFITSEDDTVQDSQDGLGTSSQRRHFRADDDATSIAMLLDSGNVTPIVEESSIPLTLGNLLSSGSGKLQVSDSSLMEEITISSVDDDKEASVTFIPHGSDKDTLPNYPFVQWNWTAIRTAVFVVVLAVILGCFGTSIALITQIPNNCDPVTEWWQGKIFYEIFPASFFDSNNDGIGDLQGLIMKLDYLKNDLKVDIIRLNSIFEVKYYPEHYLDIINATNIDPRLGEIKHFRNLVHNIEIRNLSLVIDLPIDHLPEIGGAHISKNDTNVISSIITFWLHHGVHGFYFKGLEKFHQQHDLWKSVALWKTIVDGYSSTKMKRRILVTSSEFLDNYSRKYPEYSSKMHDQFELVDYYININQIGDLESQIKKGLVWDNDIGKSWVMWNVGNIDKPRLANLSQGQGCNGNFGSLMLLFTLPGSVSVFYGDEIGLNNVQSSEGDNIGKNLQSLPIMQWNESPNVGFTSSSSLPWLPVNTPLQSSYCIHTSIMKFGQLTSMRNTALPLRVNVISKYKDDVIESRIHNYIYRLFYNDTALIERYYPRRHRYLLINNLSQKNVTHDLSSQYFGGQTLMSSTGKKEGYVKLKGLGLQPRESLLLLLDK